MAALRRQGITYQEIGERVGQSERTVRRYVGHVQPQLHLPQEGPELETDPRALREQLLAELVLMIYHDRLLRSWTMTLHRVDDSTQEVRHGGPPSILFMGEAERLIRERLEKLGPNSLRLLAIDNRSKSRFIREVVGPLYKDYASWHRFSQIFDEAGEDWRPPRERPPAKVVDEDDIDFH